MMSQLPYSSDGRPRRKRRSRTEARQSLLQTGPSTSKRVAIFAFVSLCVSGFTLLIPNFDFTTDGMVLATLGGASVLVFTLYIRNATTRRRKLASIGWDAASGFGAGAFTLTAIGAMIAFGGQSLRTQPGELGVKSDGPAEVIEYSKVEDQPKSNEEQSVKETSGEVVVEAKRTSDAEVRAVKPTNEISSDKQQVQKPAIQSVRLPTPAEPIAVPRPIILPAGTRIRSVATDESTIAVRVEKSPQTYVKRLQSQDFRVTSATGKSRPFRLIEHPERTTAATTSIVFLVDQSLNRFGDHAVAMRLVNNVMHTVPHADFRAVSYGAHVRILTTWTRDAATIWTALSRSPHTHGPMLPTAMKIGAEDAGKRRGRRILMLFTDGFGHPPQHATPDMVRLLLQNDIQLIVVRTNTGRDDAVFLDGLLAAVKGQFFQGTNTDGILKHVRRLSTEKVPTFYSLILPGRPLQWPVTIDVGSGDSALKQVVHRPNSVGTH